MPLLSQITHPRRNVELKVNFFANYFKYYNHNLGKNGELFFENHLSLLEKINYHLKLNPKYRNNYLPSYFQHFFFKDKGFISRFNGYSRLEPLITNYLGLTNRRNTWIVQNPNLIKFSKELEDELREKMFSVALESLISYLYCRHTLKFHIKDIMYATRILITELRFNKTDSKEVGKLISKIMSRDEKRFPLPNEISQHIDNDEFKEIAKDFFKNRTFKQQFEGILNYHNEKNKDEFFIFRIQGFKANKDFEFDYNNVKVISKQNKILKTLKKVIKEKDFYNDFNNTRNTVIAYTKIKYHTSDEGKRIAINQISKALDYINLKLNTEGTIDKDFCLWTEDFINFGGIKSFKYRAKKLEEDELEKLTRENPFEILKDNSSPAAIQFLEFEPLYHRCLISNEVTDFWHYLECLIPKEPSSNMVNKLVVKKAAKVVMNGYKTRILRHYKLVIFNSVDSHIGDKNSNVSIPYAEKNIIWDTWEESDIFKTYKKLNNPFINLLIQEGKKSTSKLLQQTHYNYYKDVFNELYEIRNSFTHSGYKMNKLENKMTLIIPRLIQIVRFTILREILNSRRRNLYAVVEKIIKRINLND